jgi:hypothetical protein
MKKSFITKYPSFLCILLCCRRKDNKGTISSAVQFPALGFDIKGDNAPYDLSATVHHMPRKDDGGHYTAIVRSQDLQSQEWFMYDDDRVSTSKFTNKQKKHTMVLKNHMKTATILFYVCPSLKTRIKNAKTIDLIELEKDMERSDSEMNSFESGFENSGDINVDGGEGYADGYRGDGEEGNADGFMQDSNLHEKDVMAGSNEGAATVAPVGAVTAAVGVHDEEEKGDSSEEASPTAASSATTRRKKRKKARAKKALRRAELFASSSSSSSDDEDYKETIRDRRKSRKKVNKAQKKAAKQRSTKKTVRSDSESSSSSDLS